MIAFISAIRRHRQFHLSAFMENIMTPEFIILFKLGRKCASSTITLTYKLAFFAVINVVESRLYENLN